MTSWLDKLNLQPQERRLVLVGFIILALLLNYWLIIPYFREWGPVNALLVKARKDISTYVGEIGKKAQYESKLKELQASAPGILPAGQANLVQQKIQSQAIASGVTVNNLLPVNRGRTSVGQTNDFFDEVVMQVDVNAGEKELIDFLYALGEGDSNIRVREIVNLRLDPSQTRLQTKLTLAASFQKKAPLPANTSTSRPAGGATNRPAGAPTNRPAGAPTDRIAATSTNRPVAGRVQPKGPEPSTNKPTTRLLREGRKAP